ncbi:proline dehydrogenase family protein [Aureitalea marina]|uniref:Proline dehydrogenase n=1 Tax=Aureitalea marina TaxID=930804 RepID=A0A2S7KPC8_9FLAO|nr:proline dehydrogenase family protein [Aureitalea marina]PQB04460.1 proline dehydrogenase [Aureitalea marina]
MIPKTLFEDTETAFSLKSDSELERAYFLFKMISKEPLVRIGTSVTKFALNVNLPVEGLIRSTVFDHFCGGVSEDDCASTVEKLAGVDVYSVLDYSVEGKEEEQQFDRTLDKVMELTRHAKDNPNMPFAVFKPTGFGRFAIWQKVSEGGELSSEEKAEWERIVARYDTICAEAVRCDVVLLIDGEESWMQQAADDLCEAMMQKYNKEKPIVYNTLQCYRWDRLAYLKEIHQRARENNYHLGFKIVRGAYMEKENDRAEAKGYPTPICGSKSETDEHFNQVMRYILDNLSEIGLFLGTHNELSTYLAMERMKEMGLNENDKQVWFGQLFGMSDHISYNLAKAGYNVAKYIPFGPVKDVMPYLIRRAEENTSVAGQTNRELDLLKREKQRRGI